MIRKYLASKPVRTPFQDYQRRQHQAQIAIRIVWSVVFVGLIAIAFGGVAP